jgi:hypothetical protein
LAAAFTVILFTAGCAPGPNQLAGSPDDAGAVAGFWKGLWHGFIVVFTFIVSLFNDNVRIYEVHNSGNWYNFGYLLGVMMFFGGGGGGACRGSKR